MTIPSFSMRQLLESGVHFGHHTRRWNPKMAPFIFGVRNKIHIINLEETVPLLSRALQAIRDVAASGGRILFVGTKKSISEIVAESAKNCGQYYVNYRWLGGMMTNFSTVSQSISRLKKIDERLESDEVNILSKKEILKLTREREKLNNSLGGIREMGGLPDMLFVIDTIKDSIAVSEAKVLKIPVMAIIDSNSDPDGIDYPVPGNDDAMRAVSLYCSLVSESILDGLKAEMINRDPEQQESHDNLVEPELVAEKNENNKIQDSNNEKGDKLDKKITLSDKKETLIKVVNKDKQKSLDTPEKEKVIVKDLAKENTIASTKNDKVTDKDKDKFNDENKIKVKKTEKKSETEKKNNDKKIKEVSTKGLNEEKLSTNKDKSKSEKIDTKETKTTKKPLKETKPLNENKEKKLKTKSKESKSSETDKKS